MVWNSFGYTVEHEVEAGPSEALMEQLENSDVVMWSWWLKLFDVRRSKNNDELEFVFCFSCLHGR
jgi:hypothetical protein